MFDYDDDSSIMRRKKAMRSSPSFKRPDDARPSHDVSRSDDSGMISGAIIGGMSDGIEGAIIGGAIGSLLDDD